MERAQKKWYKWNILENGVILITYITMNMHQIEEDLSLMKPSYD